MKRTQRVIEKTEAEKALKYAINLIKKDILINDLDLESEEVDHLKKLIEIKKAFKKRQEIIMV